MGKEQENEKKALLSIHLSYAVDPTAIHCPFAFGATGYDHTPHRLLFQYAVGGKSASRAGAPDRASPFDASTLGIVQDLHGVFDPAVSVVWWSVLLDLSLSNHHGGLP